MNELEQRVARAIDPDAGWDDPVPVSYHSKGAHLEGAKASEAFRRIDRAYSRAQAVLAQLPLTPEQLDGLASGDMMVVPSDTLAPTVRQAQESVADMPEFMARNAHFEGQDHE